MVGVEWGWRGRAMWYGGEGGGLCGMGVKGEGYVVWGWRGEGYVV